MNKLTKNFLNYQGSKFRFIEEILKELPEDTDTKFLDLFGGGGDVTINVPYSTVVYNDLNKPLKVLLELTYTNTLVSLESRLYELVDTFKLTASNKEGYILLKDYYNDGKFAFLDPIEELCAFYLLICHSFSNQIRYNAKGEWNMPFGKRYFNPSLRRKLKNFSSQIKTKDVTFLSEDFREIVLDDYEVVYCDPPYTGTTAAYQDNKLVGWSDEDDKYLFDKLDEYGKVGGKFLMSNQLWSKGKENKSLSEWVKRENLTVIHLESDYSSCNYQRKGGRTEEVLIKNY